MTNTADSPKPAAHSNAPLIASIIAGAVVFALLVGAGIIVANRTSTQWVARSNALVLPSKPVDAAQLPGYYETLSRGQIVTTLAELARLGEFQGEVADTFDLSDAQRNHVDVSVNVITNTAMLQVAATSEDPNLAIAMADGVVEKAAAYIGDLVLPYSLVPVSKGSNNLGETGVSSTMMLGVFMVVALAAGLVVQQATLRLMRLARQRNREPRDNPEIAITTAHRPWQASSGQAREATQTPEQRKS